MPGYKFFEMLERRWKDGRRVCIGLDPDFQKIPEWFGSADPFSRINGFMTSVVSYTHTVALAYKPNLGFYLEKGVPGLNALVTLCRTIKTKAPDVPIILDGKFNDIGNTAKGYARFAFDECGADAVTVNPYLGQEALQPFLEYERKGVIVLCKTSNPGSGEFQYICSQGGTVAMSLPLYQQVAHRVSQDWNTAHNCGLVVGATYLEDLGKVRKIVGDMWLLVPGVGTQGGDVEKIVRNGLNRRGNGLIINSSSGIIFAQKKPDDLEAPYRAAVALTTEINAAIEAATAPA